MSRKGSSSMFLHAVAHVQAQKPVSFYESEKDNRVGGEDKMRGACIESQRRKNELDELHKRLAEAMNKIAEMIVRETITGADD
jgi:hypothetical protein